MSPLIIVLAIVDIVVCLGLVFLVVFQEGNSKGLGVISGGADTFFGQGKGRTIDVMLKKMTSVLAIIFAVLSIVLFLLTGRSA